MIKESRYTKETIQKMSEVKIGKKNPMYDVHLIPWNKGLTKGTDKRVMQTSKCLKGHIPWNKGVPRSEQTKEKISIKKTGTKMSTKARENISRGHIGLQVGDKGSNWKGGITPLNKTIRDNCKMKEWRLMVFGRDDFICKECGHRGGYLHAHHITPFSSIIQLYEITTLEEALNCAELWNINNGITLCKECHKKLHKKVKI